MVFLMRFAVGRRIAAGKMKIIVFVPSLALLFDEYSFSFGLVKL